MNFVQSIKDGFARCFDFSGRSSRRQFWFFYLFHELSTSIAFIADNVFGLSLYKIPIAEVNLETVYISFGPIFIFTFFLILIPFFAVKVRRFHDVGKSGWWYLILLTVIGIIPFLYWVCKKGDTGPNKYGEDIEAGR